MSVFGGLVITNAGRNLYAKAQTGKQLKLKRIAIGDGELGSSESMINLTNLKNEVMSCNIISCKVLQNEIAKVTFILKNQDVQTGFCWREIGVIAEDADTEEEVLYCYGNARENGEYISAAGEADILEKRVSIDLIVSNVKNISAIINESLVYITKDEFNKALETKADLVDGKISPSQLPTIYSLPTGGTTGQVVQKNSNANGDVKWGNLGKQYEETILFSNSSGNSTYEIQLNSNVSNYDYVEIFGLGDSDTVIYYKVYDPNTKDININTSVMFEGVEYQSHALCAFVDNKFYKFEDREYKIDIQINGARNVVKTNWLKIVKIVGHKAV